MRALRKLRRDYPTDTYVFVSERGGPISPIGFYRLVQRLGEAAKMPFPIHPHMLRHACGFKLANDGHDTRALQHYLGHKKHPAHRSVHRHGTRPLQGLLEGLMMTGPAKTQMTLLESMRGSSVRSSASGCLVAFSSLVMGARDGTGA